MLFADNPSLPIDSWVQYGCFGLLACIVAWTLFKGIPNMLASFKDALQETTDSFREEQRACREERVARDVWIASEFAANRASNERLIESVRVILRSSQSKGD